MVGDPWAGFPSLPCVDASLDPPMLEALRDWPGLLTSPSPPALFYTKNFEMTHSGFQQKAPSDQVSSSKYSLQDLLWVPMVLLSHCQSSGAISSDL